MNTNTFLRTTASNSNCLDKFIAVIPAGGVCTRLWPLSRASAPRFLHDLTGSGPNRIMLVTEPKDSGAAIGLTAAILFTRAPKAPQLSFRLEAPLSDRYWGNS